MIRNWDANETGPLLELWLESTIHAHPFIAESYWHDSLAIVRDVYLPSAQTWVWEQDGVLKGFISVMESRFIGALFVAPDAARQGIGSALIGEVKKHYGWLTLEVYQKNVQAVNFYHAQGFRIEDCAWQDETQHPTWIMHWSADQMPSAYARARYTFPARPAPYFRRSRYPAAMSEYLWSARSPHRFCKFPPEGRDRATPLHASR